MINFMNKKVFIYDVETLSNCFTYSAIDRDTDEIKTFVIWKNRNDLPELLEHLNNCSGQIGFNNLAFDANIIEFILKNKDRLLNYSGDKIAKRIYKEAQITIEKEWSEVRYPTIPQLDVYKIHHFDNRAKMCSLKKLEIAMGFESVQDMPIHHTQEIQNDQEIDMILEYNINDIKATKMFYEKTLEKIELRKGLLKKYNLPCINYSDSKIGEELVLKLYCEATDKNAYQLKKLGGITRNTFKFKDCIPDYIEFKTREFNELLDYLKGIERSELKDSFSHVVNYKNSEFFLGTGGIHQSIKEGIYESDEDYFIIDADVASLYPSLAVVNEIYPEHLGKEFCSIYEGVLKERLEAKARKDMVMADGYKLALNSVYGKSNSPYSVFFDGLYTLKTTLAGQLSLCLLVEMLSLEIDDLLIIQTNTDGITVKIKREDKRKYWEVCKLWQKITKLTLEYVVYDKMILRDVNNYIAISTDGKVKRKGVFKLHEEMKAHGEWHKAFNQGIVPIALSEFFLKNIPVEETIKNHKNIFDFCKTFSTRGNFTSETFSLDENGNEINIQEEQKTIRYYVSTDGIKFRKRGQPLKPKYMSLSYFTSRYKYDEENIYSNNKELFDKIKLIVKDKCNELLENKEINSISEAKVIINSDSDSYKILSYNYPLLNSTFNVSSVELNRSDELSISCRKDWRLIEIEAGDFLVTIFNNYKNLNFEDYNINYDYYIQECNKIIDTITGKRDRVLMEKRQAKELERLKREEQNFIQFCINKIPTSRQYEEYKRDWLIEKYGEVKEIKESVKRKTTNE